MDVSLRLPGFKAVCSGFEVWVSKCASHECCTASRRQLFRAREACCTKRFELSPNCWRCDFLSWRWLGSKRFPEREAVWSRNSCEGATGQASDRKLHTQAPLQNTKTFPQTQGQKLELRCTGATCLILRTVQLCGSVCS